MSFAGAFVRSLGVQVLRSGSGFRFMSSHMRCWFQFHQSRVSGRRDKKRGGGERR